MTWELHRLGVENLDEVMRIELPVFGADAWSESVMRSELASANCWYVGARDPEDGSLAGYGGVLSPRGAAESDIQTIAVLPQHRGSGLGRTLMIAMLGEAAIRGARETFLEVRADNLVAQGLYRSLGFLEIARREGYYQPDGVAAIIMRRDRQHPDRESGGLS